MTYRITGLAAADVAPLFALDKPALAERLARRVTADADHGYPCRVSLEDARAGERLVLMNHVSLDVATPFRASHAIYVREDAKPWPTLADRTPPVFEGRVLSLRGFSEAGDLVAARLAQPGEADAGIRALFAEPAVAYIHAHFATYGCFAARVDRFEGSVS